MKRLLFTLAASAASVAVFANPAGSSTVAKPAPVTAGNEVELIAVGPGGSLWVATCPKSANPTVTANWTWTQLPPIPVT